MVSKPLCSPCKGDVLCISARGLTRSGPCYHCGCILYCILDHVLLGASKSMAAEIQVTMLHQLLPRGDHKVREYKITSNLVICYGCQIVKLPMIFWIRFI